MHVIASKAVAFKEALAPEFKEYQKQTIANAAKLAEGLKARGFKIVSGGTDTHLMLVDLRNKDITGKVAEKLLDRVHVTVNKNTVPKETQSPFVTSGIRIGTPALTTRGMKEDQMLEIAGIIADAIEAKASDEDIISRVHALCEQFHLLRIRY